MPAYEKLHSITLIAAAAIANARLVSRTGSHAASSSEVAGISEQAAKAGSAFSAITSFSGLVEAAEVIPQGSPVKPAADGSGRAAVGTDSESCGWAVSGATKAGAMATVHVVESRGASVSGDGFSTALLGDSFTRRCQSVGSPCRDLDWGYFTWAQAFLGGPFNVVLNAGVSGERTDQILARIQSVYDAKPDWCFVLGGINNIRSGSAPTNLVTTIVSDLKQICTGLTERGIKVVLLAIAPNTQEAGNCFKVQQVNQAMQEWAQRDAKGVIFVNTFAPSVNASDPTGAAKAGVLEDSLHLSAKGGRIWGQEIATTLQPVLPMRSFLPTSAAADYSLDATSKQILTNPLMIGAGPAATGTGAGGTAPLGWQGSVSGSVASAVFSQVARADGFGNDAQIVVTGAASGASVNIRQTGLVGRAAIGDSLYVVGHIQATGMVDVKGINIGGSATIDGVTYQINPLELSGSVIYDQSDLSIPVCSARQVLAGAVISAITLVCSATFGASGAGAGTFKFGRVGQNKVPA